MRTTALLLATIGLGLHPVASAADVNFSDTGFKSAEIVGPRKPTLDVVLGYSSDDINFDIAADPTGEMTPNVLSELNWYDMEVASIRADLVWPLGKGLRLRGMIDYGIILNGDSLDTDYLGDNRTNVWFKSTASVDGDDRYQGELEVGWEFRWSFAVPTWRIGDSAKRRGLVSEVSLTPSIGYQISGHDIQFTDGVLIEPPVGPFAELNSSYAPEWKGLTTAVDLRMRLGSRLMLGARYLYSDWLDFEALSTWNLRDDWEQDPSFVHTADGSGERLEVNLEYLMGKEKNRSIYLSYIDNQYKTEPGRDTTFFAGGSSFVTRLNEASWNGHGFEIGFRFRFQ